SLHADDAGAGFSGWSYPVNLGPVVNSDGLDQDPTLSPDELSLYFTSDRPGGYGIWASHRECRECAWQTPVKLQLVPDDFEGGLGPTQAVGAPALSRDGHLLFFSRCIDCGASHFPGTSDIFVARRSNAKDDFGWGPAVPLVPTSTRRPTRITRSTSKARPTTRSPCTSAETSPARVASTYTRPRSR